VTKHRRELYETAGEDVTVTKHAFQAVSPNRNASDLFACISKSVGRVK